MLSFKDFRNGTEPKAAVNETAAATICEDRNPYLAKVDKIVDDFVAQLKAELMRGAAGSPSASLWQRFKKGVSNLWYGKSNPDNPYVYQNRFGELGQKVESVTNIHIPLEEYKVVREAFRVFEEEISTGVESGAANLRLMKVIDDQAALLKRKLRDLMNAVGSKMDFGPKPQQMRPPIRFSKPASETPPADSTTPTPTDDAKSQDAFHFENLPKTNKKWEELTEVEKQVWNHLGGGLVPRSHRSSVGVELPYVLRIGDPRIKKIEAANKLKWFKDRHRIELASKPINSQAELQQAVQKVKEGIRTGTEGRVSNVPVPERPETQATRSSASSRSSPQSSSSPDDATIAPAPNAPEGSGSAPVPEDDPMAPSIGPTPRQESAKYKKLKAAAEKMLEKHTWSSEEEKSKLIELLNQGEDKEAELDTAVRDTLKKVIDNEADEDEKKRLKQELEDADTPEKVQEVIDQVYFNFLDHTRHIVNQFRKLCQG